jgi:hypothetical protein
MLTHGIHAVNNVLLRSGPGIAILFACALLMPQCAHQVAPEGGPVDKIPPVIIRTEPDSNAVRVKDDRITIEFSEHVDRRSVEESIFISPPVAAKEFEWSGTEVTILIKDTLKPDVTYVVTVGTDVVDRRAGVRMAAGYTLAFSTGDSIDLGSISGKVFDAKPEGISMFAYRLDSLNPDTLDPVRHRPDYLMQTGLKGAFAFSNLAWGRYRLVAVRDEYRNLLYDRQTDQYGVASAEVVLSPDHPIARGVQLRMAKEDTARPFLSGVRTVGDRLVLVRFSERVDSAAFAAALMEVTDTLGGNPVAEQTRYLDPVGRESGGLVLERSLLPDGIYLFRCSGVSDSTGNVIDSSGGVMRFQAATDPDTSAASFEYTSLRDSVNGYDMRRPLDIVFSEPVRKEPAARAFSLIRSSGDTLRLQTHWLSPVRLQVSPSDIPPPHTQLEVQVVLDSVQDLAGNAVRDSVRTVRFRSFDQEATGEIEGGVIDSEVSGTGWIYVTATSIKGALRKSIRIPQPGSFVVSDLPEGIYMISAFRDTDSTGSFTFGRPAPYLPSERFAINSDTLRVRARWSVEGVTLQLK